MTKITPWSLILYEINCFRTKRFLGLFEGQSLNADGKFFSANYKEIIHGLFFKDLMATVQNQTITYYQIAWLHKMYVM